MMISGPTTQENHPAVVLCIPYKIPRGPHSDVLMVIFPRVLDGSRRLGERKHPAVKRRVASHLVRALFSYICRRAKWIMRRFRVKLSDTTSAESRFLLSRLVKSISLFVSLLMNLTVIGLFSGPWAALLGPSRWVTLISWAFSSMFILDFILPRMNSEQSSFCESLWVIGPENIRDSRLT